MIKQQVEPMRQLWAVRSLMAGLLLAVRKPRAAERHVINLLSGAVVGSVGGRA